MQQHQADLEVVHRPEDHLPQAYKDHSPYHEYSHGDQRGPPTAPASPPPRRVCGVPAKRFWIIAAIVTFIAVGAIVGGAVGGTMAIQSDASDSDSEEARASRSSDHSKSTSDDERPVSTSDVQSDTATSTPTPTEAGAVSLTTHTLVNPTRTHYCDCPSSDDTIYEARGSPRYQFRKMCDSVLENPTWTGPNLIGSPVRSLDECIELCAAWDSRYRKLIADAEYPFCGAVCWRNSPCDEWPGMCFGVAVSNTTDNEFRVQFDSVCDSAAWINVDDDFPASLTGTDWTSATDI